MKVKTVLLIFMLTALRGMAQISIIGEDMPVTGDTLRISLTANLAGHDPSQTGAGYFWNYSDLQHDTQRVERFLNTNATPFIYQFIFNQNVANLAYPIDAIGFIPGIEITDAYIFYKKNAGSYLRAGYAATVMGLPLPMKFDYPELLYTFPLTMNSPRDSSLSNFSLGLPSFGYLSIERKRINEVDGWGNLTTPFGTFEVLRIRSSVYERDSIYIDSIQTGLPIIRNYTEYQWLAKEQGIPVLTITVEGPLVTATYRDFARINNSLSITTEDKTICRGETTTLSVQVSGGEPPYNYLWSTGDQSVTISVSPDETTTYSVVVTDAQNRVAMGSSTVNVLAFERLDLGSDTLLCAGNSISFHAGIMYDQVKWYFNEMMISQENSVTLDTSLVNSENVKVRVEYVSGPCQGSDEIEVQFMNCQRVDEKNYVKLKFYPNPVADVLIVSFPHPGENFEITICNVAGQILDKPEFVSGKDQVIVQTSALRPGVYFLKVSNNNHTGTAVFTKQ